MTRKPDFNRAREAAEGLLCSYNVISAPVPLVEIVQGEGLSVAYAPLDEFRNPEKPVCAALLKNQRVILVEKTDSPARQRFSIAHELGHWKLHPKELESHPGLGVFFRAPVGKESNPLEQEANMYGACLLVPRRLLLEWHEKTHNQHQLAEIFGVSSELMGWRLINEGLVG